MSNVYAHTIHALEGELDALDQRRGEIEKAIAIIRPLAGDAIPEDDLETERSAPRAPRRKAIHRRGGIPRSNATKATTGERTNERTSKARAKVTRSRGLPDGAEPMDEQILSALRAGGPMKPADLAARVRLTVTALRYHVNRLIASGWIEATGQTLSRRLSLTLKGAKNAGASAPPAQPPASQAPAVAPPEAIVQARDRAILDRLKRGRATLDELVSAMPAEPGLSDADTRTACMKAVRRLTMRGQVADVGDKFMVVGG